MQFFHETHFDFVGWRRKAFAISGVLIIASIISLVVKGGPKLSVDFKGGVVLELTFQQPVTTEVLRSALDRVGYGRSEIVSLGTPTQFLIRAEAEANKDVTSIIKSAISQSLPSNPYQIVREEMVGPKVGKELARKAIWSTVIACGAMLIYIAWRFEFRFGVGAIASLVHDVITVVGLFSILNREISPAVIAAVLTLVGYSVNDTIVVFDRIREDLRKYHREPLETVINNAVNETLSRTVITAFTVFIVVLVLYIMGGEVLRDFSFAMLYGVITGCYSSVFVAAPILVEWNLRSPMRRR
ncbi:MAG TPA: protein translocase subunit SecF [bacterium]|nr:protein translocase subunit SecF [bacterium]